MGPWQIQNRKFKRLCTEKYGVTSRVRSLFLTHSSLQRVKINIFPKPLILKDLLEYLWMLINGILQYIKKSVASKSREVILLSFASKSTSGILSSVLATQFKKDRDHLERDQ